MSGRYDPDGSSSSRRSSRDDRGYGGDEDEYDYPPRGSSRDDRASSRGNGRGDYGQRSNRQDDYDPPASRSGSGTRRPGSPGQPVWEQAVQPAYPAYAGRVAAPARPKRKSRRGLWITLGIIAALLLALGGAGAYAATRYFAPAGAAGEFCRLLTKQSYTQAYGDMSASAQSQATSAQFGDAFAALDQVEGKVSACAAATGANSYSASVFGSAATVALVMTRDTAGPLQGSLHLKKESSGWHVDAIDGSLLGVSLGAVVAADSYCAALKTQQYANAYALLGAKLQAASKQADFVQLAGWHDTVDGQVSACQLTAIATGGTDAAAGFTLSLTRAKLAAKKGALALAVESGAWTIGSIDAALQGSDLSPLQTGGRFCADLASVNYADAYTVGDATWWGGRTATQAAGLLAGTSSSSGGLTWTSCTLDAATLATKSGYLSYKMTFTFTKKATGQTAPVTETVALAQVSGVWKLHGILHS